MEKKQKLLPFDLNRYLKENRKLCTRNGKSVRILCADLKNDMYKIVAAVSYTEGEFARMYTETGFIRRDEYETDDDLMMLPIKRKGWINIYKTSIEIDKKSSEEKEKTLNFYYNRSGIRIYNTEEEAKINATKKEDYITTTKIEWEE